MLFVCLVACGLFALSSGINFDEDPLQGITAGTEHLYGNAGFLPNGVTFGSNNAPQPLQYSAQGSRPFPRYPLGAQFGANVRPYGPLPVGHSGFNLNANSFSAGEPVEGNTFKGPDPVEDTQVNSVVVANDPEEEPQPIFGITAGLELTPEYLTNIFVGGDVPGADSQFHPNFYSGSTGSQMELFKNMGATAGTKFNLDALQTIPYTPQTASTDSAKPQSSFSQPSRFPSNTPTFQQSDITNPLLQMLLQQPISGFSGPSNSFSTLQSGPQVAGITNGPGSFFPTSGFPGYQGHMSPFQQSPFQQSPFQQSPFQQSPFQQSPVPSSGFSQSSFGLRQDNPFVNSAQPFQYMLVTGPPTGQVPTGQTPFYGSLPVVASQTPDYLRTSMPGGSPDFGYTGGPSTRYEVRDTNGDVKGFFQYIDAFGSLQHRQYVADKNGFRIIPDSDISKQNA